MRGWKKEKSRSLTMFINLVHAKHECEANKRVAHVRLLCVCINAVIWKKRTKNKRKQRTKKKKNANIFEWQWMRMCCCSCCVWVCCLFSLYLMIRPRLIACVLVRWITASVIDGYVNKWMWFWFWIFAYEGYEMCVESRSLRPNIASMWNVMVPVNVAHFEYSVCSIRLHVREKHRLQTKHYYHCLFRQRLLTHYHCRIGYARHHSFKLTHEYCNNAKVIVQPRF